MSVPRQTTDPRSRLFDRGHAALVRRTRASDFRFQAGRLEKTARPYHSLDRVPASTAGIVFRFSNAVVERRSDSAPTHAQRFRLDRAEPESGVTRDYATRVYGPTVALFDFLRGKAPADWAAARRGATWRGACLRGLNIKSHRTPSRYGLSIERPAVATDEANPAKRRDGYDRRGSNRSINDTWNYGANNDERSRSRRDNGSFGRTRVSKGKRTMSLRPSFGAQSDRSFDSYGKRVAEAIFP